MQLQIDPEFKKLIEPLMCAEYEGLEKNIIANGCLDSVKIWFNVIIDGHNRYEICQKHGIPFETKQMDFQSRNDAKEWIIRNQFDRRNLSAWQRGQMALELKEIISAKAKENQTLSQGRGIKGLENSTNLIEPIDTRLEIAKIAGVSDNTISRVETIKSEGTPEQIERLQNKTASINEVYNEVKSKPHVSNGTGDYEWYTPVEYIESARKVMGNIDLDPASCELANTVVKAKEIYTYEIDGLAQEWHGNVWMNPPYSAKDNPRFIDKLITEYKAGHIKSAIVLVNNATETRWFLNLISIATVACFPTGRLKFWSEKEKGSVPLQGQTFVYIGSDVDRFTDEFNKYGWIAKL